MRKIIFVIIVAALLTGCDPGSDCYFYVRNHCSDTISVITTKEYADTRPLATNITYVPPGENKLIYNNLVLDTPPELYFIQYFFSSITIIQGVDTSKKDFMNPLLWELTTNERGKNYDANFNLTINPEDFD